MKLFAVVSALAPLKVHGAVRAVAERQKHFSFELSGAAQFHVGHGIRDAGAGLHHQERFVQHRIVHVVTERHQRRLPLGLPVVPGGITVVADEVAQRRELPVVQRGKESHQVGGDRRIGEFPDRLNLHAEEVDDLFRAEPPPVQRRPVHRAVERLHLAPVGEPVPPEGGPVRLVELLQRTVSLPQEVMKLFSAPFTAALPVVFVGDVPSAERRVPGVPFRQFAVDDSDPFPVAGRGEAAVLPRSPPLAVSGPVRPAAVRPALRQPGRLRGRRRRQEDFFPALCAALKHIVEPAEFEPVRFHFQLRPGEDRHRERVAVRLVHQFEIPVDRAGGGEPLVRIVVAAVQNLSEVFDDHSISSPGFRRVEGVLELGILLPRNRSAMPETLLRFIAVPTAQSANQKFSAGILPIFR